MSQPPDLPPDILGTGALPAMPQPSLEERPQPLKAFQARPWTTAPGGDLQTPFEAAVIVATILRPTLLQAVRSIFAQDLQGRVQILIGIDKVKGDRGMLDALRAREWPKPVGGEVGLARKSFDFDPPNDVRPPTELSSEEAGPGLDKLNGKLKECKDGKRGFEATLYVGTEGEVLAAGATPPDEEGEEGDEPAGEPEREPVPAG